MYIGRQYEYGGVANAICNYMAICRQHQFRNIRTQKMCCMMGLQIKSQPLPSNLNNRIKKYDGVGIWQHIKQITCQ